MIKKAAALIWSVVSCQLSVVLILFSLFTLTLALARPVHAQNCAPTPNLAVRNSVDAINKCAIQQNIFDDKIFNLNQIAGTTDSIYSLLTGKSQLHPETNGATAGGGALAASGRLVATLYSAPPVSGVQYFASVFNKFNPVQPAYAQAGGIGFQILSPIQNIWTVFRNISYVGFVIVFVILGFMIMFRSRISPQAVATVQDSIPRIVIALILVTFSYALSGLFIDIMFLILNIIINTLRAAGLLAGTDIGTQVFEKSVFGVVWGNWKSTFQTVADALANILDQVISIPVLDKIVGFFGGTLGAIVVGIALLFIMFRVFFMLLLAYVTIIILTMFAPFFFLIQALPGLNGAGQWFRQMAANVAVFPTVALMFVFAGVLGGLGGGAGAIDSGQVGQFPLLAGDIDPAVIGKLIGIGFLLITPSAAELVKNAIGARGQGPGVAAGAMAGLAAGGAVVGAAGRGAGGAIATQGPIGGWRRAREAKRQESAQRAAGLRTYTSEYEERQREEDERARSS